MGELEARIITNKLLRETEVIVWQILLISAALIGLPLLLALILFEASEFLLFAAYLVLPFVPVYSAASGWRFHRFEQQNKVQVFMFIYGFKFWTEPILSDSDRLCHFINDVASKDALAILSQAGYSKKLIVALQERQDIETSTKKELSKILLVMNKYKRQMLTVFAAFLISCFLLIVYFLVLASTNMFGIVEIVNHNVVSGQAASLILLCVPTFSVLGGVFIAAWRLRKRYRKVILRILENLNLDKLSSILSYDEM
ncbi:MAG: hypothetical protein QXR89_02655 [Candidatus Bathyarchaeia archaeon]